MKNKIFRNIAVFVGLLLLGFALWNVRNVVRYFVVAIIMSLIGRPLFKALGMMKVKQKSLPNGIKALLTLVTILSIWVGLAWILIPTLAKQAEVLAQADYGDVFEVMQSQMFTFLDRLNEKGVSVPTPEEIQAGFLSYFDIQNVPLFLHSILAQLGQTFVWLFSVSFISFFLLKDSYILNNSIQALSPDRYLKQVENVFARTKHLLSRYFLGLLAQFVCIFTIVVAGLSIVGVHNAFFIAFLYAMVNVVPYIGPIIGGILGLFLTFTGHIDLGFPEPMVQHLLQTLLVFVVAQLVDNIVLQPTIFSRSVKAHPLEIFTVSMITATLAGPLSMIFAIPLYTFLRIVAKEFLAGYKVVQGLTKNL